VVDVSVDQLLQVFAVPTKTGDTDLPDLVNLTDCFENRQSAGVPLGIQELIRIGRQEVGRHIQGFGRVVVGGRVTDDLNIGVLVYNASHAGVFVDAGLVRKVAFDDSNLAGVDVGAPLDD
jgi:hypothetical protein